MKEIIEILESSEFGMADLSLFLAASFKKSILVSTRHETRPKNTRAYLPNEFPPSHGDEVATQFSKGATLIIDAQLQQAVDQAQAKLEPMTEKQRREGREAIFSTGNPYCPCDQKTFDKVTGYVERFHQIGDKA